MVVFEDRGIPVASENKYRLQFQQKQAELRDIVVELRDVVAYPDHWYGYISE